MKKNQNSYCWRRICRSLCAKYLDKKLARRPDIEVTLIARENFILFTADAARSRGGRSCAVDIVNPLRRILRHVNVIEADVQDVDLTARKVRCVHGLGPR
jgi:NADH dehydrogenase FAD-containing subunit